MERSEALSKNLPTFTTGRPCKNGHVTFRYTESGSCSDCLKAASRDVAKLARQYRKECREINLSCHVDDVALLTETVWSTLMLRYPGLTRKRAAFPHKVVLVSAAVRVCMFKASPWDEGVLTAAAYMLMKQRRQIILARGVTRRDAKFMELTADMG